MLISELISKLKELESEHGDIQVTCYPYDGQMYSSHVSEMTQLEHTSEDFEEANKPVAYGAWPRRKPPFLGKYVVLDA